MLCASGGLAAMADALAGLEVFPARMQENLSRVPAAVLSGAIPALIAQALTDHQAFEFDAP
jgi:adenylosuccinate lyase